jgi:hypothetical protein
MYTQWSIIQSQRRNDLIFHIISGKLMLLEISQIKKDKYNVDFLIIESRPKKKRKMKQALFCWGNLWEGRGQKERVIMG